MCYDHFNHDRFASIVNLGLYSSSYFVSPKIRRNVFTMFLPFLFRYITPEKFYVEPFDRTKGLLVIDRVSQEISLQGMYVC